MLSIKIFIWGMPEERAPWKPAIHWAQALDSKGSLKTKISHCHPYSTVYNWLLLLFSLLKVAQRGNIGPPDNSIIWSIIEWAAIKARRRKKGTIFFYGKASMCRGYEHWNDMPQIAPVDWHSSERAKQAHMTMNVGPIPNSLDCNVLNYSISYTSIGHGRFSA